MRVHRCPLSTFVPQSFSSIFGKSTSEKRHEYCELTVTAIASLIDVFASTECLISPDIAESPRTNLLLAIEGALAWLEICRYRHSVLLSREALLDIYVTGSHSIIQRIILNLLTNALKYSPYGGNITLEVENNTQTIRLDVSDEGIGIPLLQAESLFEPYYRADNVGSISGTGLGLSFVYRAMHNLGGTVTYASIVNQGTTFSLIFPAA